MNNILIVSDSFKGSVSATEVTECIAATLRNELPQTDIIGIPIADGGEGTLQTLERVLKLTPVKCLCHDALMRPITATYNLDSSGRTAYLEMAAAAGLPLLDSKDRNPLKTSTYGVGEIIRNALQKGCRHIIIGLGGSATNDAGTGMMEALGMRFLDKNGHLVSGCGENLAKITHIDTQNLIPELRQTHFTAACDVTNPFCGPKGAAHIYAPQKGASPDQVEVLEQGMISFRQVIQQATGTDITNLSGAGAAGGLGGGIATLLHGKLVSGIDLILDAIQFDHLLAQTDLIITGEGKIDNQTSMGKAIGGIAQRCRKAGKPLIALTGCVTQADNLYESGVTAIFPIQPGPVSLSQAMEHDFTLQNLQRITRQIAYLLRTGIKLS